MSQIDSASWKMVDGAISCACTCGEAAEFPAANAEGGAEEWVAAHTGPGHGPVRPPGYSPVVDQIIEDIAAGLRSLRTLDGHDISEESIYERARNIATCLVANYSISALPDED